MNKNLVGAVMVFGFASGALAASPASDSITLKGQASNMVAIKVTNAVKEHDFTAQLATATTDTALQSEPFAFEVRSNVPYALSATLVDNSAGTNEVFPEDIKYTFTDLTGAGTKVVGAVAGTPRTDAVAVKTGTLADMTGAGKTVASGERISKKGGFNDVENALAGSVQFELAPQFFAPGAEFNYVVTLTIASN